MTLQYDQSNINLRDAEPVNVQTPDGAVVDVVLDVLTADGQTLVVDAFGGGSDPADVNTNNYVVLTGAAVFTRDGATGFRQPGPFVTSNFGVVPTLTFEVNDVVGVGTQCILRITPGGVTAYNHRLKVSKIRF